MKEKRELLIRAEFWALVGVVVLGFTGCGQKSQAPAAQASAPAEAPPTPVTTTLVTSRDVPIYNEQIGKCLSPETVSVKPQASGRIIKVDFKEGQNLKVGQPLFTIDPAPYRATLDQAQADVEVNTAALEQSEAALIQARAQKEESKAELAQMQTRQQMNVLDFQRAKGLFESNAGSKQDYESKTMARDVGEAQIRQSQASLARMDAQIKQALATIAMAKAKVASSQAAVNMAKINLGYTEIVSPIEGRAGQRLVDEGNVVNANNVGNTTALVTIQRIDPIYVEFSLPERELGNVQESMKANRLRVECTVPQRTGSPREGDVFLIDNSVQEGTGTIKLRAKLYNEDWFFWPGQFVKVRLIFDTQKDAPLIPAEALQIGQDGPFVFVVKDDSTVEIRLIKPGLRYDNVVAVNEGLKKGETVVLTGQLTLQPGMKVVAQNPPADQKEKSKDAAPEGNK
jgi:multidrug efflux system membrane fusion protein